MRILVVEDESKVASLVRRALEEEGHSVQVALDGEEGLNLALTTQPDLIILDWLLPGRDGLTICRAIRASGSHTPILMLTARDAIEHRVAGLDSGADDYLTKPFALGELLARVRALFRRGVSPQAPVLAIGDLVLDPATRSVRRGGVEIELSAREFSLLDHLMRNAGKTLTRSMIAERVWGYEFDSGTNVVDVYINYLRNKIDRGHAQKLIHTMRGVGYRLSVGGE
jgi:DNA-binding response OmpR family regulator